MTRSNPRHFSLPACALLFALALPMVSCFEVQKSEPPVKETLVEDWRDEVIYQVLVDRFDNGDPNNDYNLAVDLPNAADHRPWTHVHKGSPATRGPDDDLQSEMVRVALIAFGDAVRAGERGGGAEWGAGGSADQEDVGDAVGQRRLADAGGVGGEGAVRVADLAGSRLERNVGIGPAVLAGEAARYLHAKAPRKCFC